jgi:hypothetical protein
MRPDDRNRHPSIRCQVQRQRRVVDGVVDRGHEQRRQLVQRTVDRVIERSLDYRPIKQFRVRRKIVQRVISRSVKLGQVDRDRSGAQVEEGGAIRTHQRRGQRAVHGGLQVDRQSSSESDVIHIDEAANQRNVTQCVLERPDDIIGDTAKSRPECACRAGERVHVVAQAACGAVHAARQGRKNWALHDELAAGDLVVTGGGCARGLCRGCCDGTELDPQLRDETVGGATETCIVEQVRDVHECVTRVAWCASRDRTVGLHSARRREGRAISGCVCVLSQSAYADHTVRSEELDAAAEVDVKRIQNRCAERVVACVWRARVRRVCRIQGHDIVQVDNSATAEHTPFSFGLVSAQRVRGKQRSGDNHCPGHRRRGDTSPYFSYN